MGVPSGEVTLPDTSICGLCWPTAGPHNASTSVKLIPTSRRKRLPCSMSFIGASSFCGSSHGLEALLANHFAVRHESYVSALQSFAELLRRQCIQFSLTVLAHIGEGLVGVHVLQRAQLRIVHPHVGDHDIHARLQ